ncbi:Retrovirus-related Pol polyprotein from transposon 17.6 [Vitis vinifera]|uniref:Retrovirus-related Pol polyprotein from transposon 17.6 n=1 Tax=Vitis vinifera TaxID=29760 RepID=A0A438CQQ8_VITVI|nr:Retrovirus-related Pol polyprotein from transposon 17.6 [Vitis vinifera]
MNIWWKNALQFQLKERCLEIKQMLLDNSCPITMRLMEIPTTQVGGIIQISHGKARATQYKQPDPPSQQSSSLEQAMANLSKGRFPSHPTRTPKVSMKWKAKRENHRRRKMSSLDHSKEWNGLMQLTFGNMTLDLNIFYMSKKQITPEEEEGPEELCIIDTLVEEHCNQNMQDKLNESLVDFEEEEEAAAEKEIPKLNLKPLPVELKYTYLEENNQCPVVISSSLTSHQENCLMEVLKRCKKAIGWQISDLKGISPLVCTHHIYMEEEAKPIRQFQRRLNPHLQEVVRAEVLKLLQAGIIYPISDSPWVSPTQVVPKKSGITVVQNEKGKKLLHASLQGIFRLKLIGRSGKDHFYMSIWNICLQRMPFGLCNAPATFQRCMLSIFSDMVERIMEVFMDDITVYGGTFEECLVNLEAVLHRCIEKDLVLNWEKCHFMVRQGIVLGHIISEKGIEVDKAKVELIVKLPSQQLCQNSFDQLKKFLTTTPIVRAPNWQLPFELMCDASDFAIGAVLGQREDGKPYVIYYASKTLNEAQRNYTTTEKELLAVP